jgi:serine/threonine protein kinase
MEVPLPHRLSQSVVFRSAPRPNYRRTFSSSIDPSVLEREFTSLKSLHHPALQPFTHFDKANLSLERPYVEGVSLSELTSSSERLDLVDAFRVASSVAKAVQAVHCAGLLVQSLTTSNVIVTSERSAVLVDFGVSSIADEICADRDQFYNVVLLSPEGLQAGELIRSQSADIWRLGLILYTIFAGQYAFKEASSFAMMRRVLGGDLRMSSSVPREIRSLIGLALKTVPTERPDADWFVEHLTRAAAFNPVGVSAKSCGALLYGAANVQPGMGATRQVGKFHGGANTRIASNGRMIVRINHSGLVLC